MPAPAGPLTRGAPALVTGQPAERPGQDRRGDRVAQLPFALARVVQAQDRAIRPVIVWKVMRDRFVRLFRAPGEDRIDDRHRWHDGHDLGRLQIAPQAVHHPHTIGLLEWAELPLPYDEPAGLDHRPELRPVPAHQRCLVCDRQHHGLPRSVPKKVFLGAARATDGAATPVTIPLAGRLSLPSPGVNRLRPSRIAAPIRSLKALNT
jgi:hypothetical protein